jgi:hypothetical protein
MGLLAPELADAGQRELEGRPPYTVECIGDLVGLVALDIAKEAQCEMIVLDVDPARSWQAAAQQRERQRGVARNFEGGEEPGHCYLLESSMSPKRIIE